MTIAGDYFDGRSSRRHRVELSLAGAMLNVVGDGIARSAMLAETRISERLGSAPRSIRFADGAFCEVHDLEGLAGLLLQARYRDGLVDRLQRRLPAVLAATMLSALLVVAGYLWGLPLAAAVAAQHLPTAVSRLIGEQSLRALDRGLFAPSQLAPDRRQILQMRFSALHLPSAPRLLPRLEFRASKALGANAFTFADGSIVLLDGLPAVLDDDQVIAVLAHELGHVQGQHPLRLLIEGSALAAFWALYAGDVSSLLAAAPAAALQAHYSRDFEQAADDYAIEVLHSNDLSPALLADALEKIEARNVRGSTDFGAGYLASHPATPARIARLRAAGKQVNL